MQPDELKRRVSLLALVGERVKLRKDGVNYVGLCPFHTEDTPSFKVHPERGIYKCFGCGATGDHFTWLKEIEGLDFQAAKVRLAELAGGTLVEQRAVKTTAARAEITKVYDYHSAEGELLYQVCRKEWVEGGKKKKSFLGRHSNGKGGWIWNVKDVPLVLYRLPFVTAADVVWVVEGEKDADSLAALGLESTTPPFGAKKPWADAWTDTLKGKTVYIVPDNDAPGFEHADKIVTLIADVCKAHLVRIPEPHKDSTDWINAGGTREDFERLAAAAPQEQRRDPVKRLRGRAARYGKRGCNEIGEEILQNYHILSDKDGYVFLYSGRYWERVTDKVLQRLALDFDKIEHTNRRRRTEIANYLEIKSQQREIQWRRLEMSEIPLWNGVYDLQTGELRSHAREDFLETVIPVSYDPEATCPTWEKALWTYFGNDSAEDRQAKATALQQFFGYVLMAHAHYKKALILYGESDTGKSQVAKLLQEMVGAANCCGVSVENMDDERKRVPLVGKLLNVLTEISSRSIVADGGFKTLISTEEALLFDPKHLPPFMYAPIAKHVIATNNLPQISDHTKATFNRLLLVQFNRVIPRSEQDPAFLGKLKAELPGVLNWALQGAAMLNESDGEWIEIRESSAIVEEYRRTENEINAFLEEKCRRMDDPTLYVTAPELRERFRRWSGRNYSQKAIGNMMKHAGHPSCTVAAETSRVYRGLQWQDIIGAGEH